MSETTNPAEPSLAQTLGFPPVPPVVFPNKDVMIRDGQFTHDQAVRFSNFVRASRFSIGWNDIHHTEKDSRAYLNCALSSDDIGRMGFMEALRKTEFAPFIDSSALQFSRAVVNLDTPGAMHWPHSHSNQVVLLYYVNLFWNIEWGGETLFYSEDLKQIPLALPYTPGRLVMFDGEIAHSIRPQCIGGPDFRFTLAMVFDRVAA